MKCCMCNTLLAGDEDAPDDAPEAIDANVDEAGDEIIVPCWESTEVCSDECAREWRDAVDDDRGYRADQEWAWTHR